MTDDRDLDPKVRTWLDEPPPGPPDRKAVYARVMDRLPQTRQRRPWWPFGWNPFAAGATRSAEAEGPRPQRRSRTMFSPVRVVAATAFLAVGGSLAFMTALGPSDAPQPAAAPSAEDIAYVTGTATHTRQTSPCTTSVTPLYGENRACGHEYEWVTDDPRLSGLQSVEITRRDFRDEAAGISAIVTTGRFENDGGAWVEAEDSAPMVVFPGDSTMMGSQSVFQGTDGYDGFTAVVYVESTDEGATFDIKAVIIPTDMLPSVP